MTHGCHTESPFLFPNSVWFKLSICKLTNATCQFEKLIFAHFQMMCPDMHKVQHNQLLLLTETKVGGVTGISAGAGTLAVSVTYDFYKGYLQNAHEIREISQTLSSCKIIKMS